MSRATTIAHPLVPAREFAPRPDPGYPEELVRGRMVPLPMPKPRHGEICCQGVSLPRRYLEDRDLGRVLSNDTGIITERDPDTVYGADIVFYSYARVPRGRLPDVYLEVAPELVIEVLSPSERWPKVLQKVGAYLEAGVLVVVVLHDERRSAHVFGAEGTNRMLGPEEELVLPAILPGFAIAVRRLFA